MQILNILVVVTLAVNALIGFIAISDANAYGRYMNNVPVGDWEYHKYEDFPLWVYFVFPVGGLMYAAYLLVVRTVNAIIN